MEICYYCTPEWLEESTRIYQSNSEFKNKLKKVTSKLVYRVKADSSWGIDKDILFCVYLDAGDLIKMELISEKNAKKEANFIMGATPKTWKGILTKNNKFITDFMLGKVRLEMGSKVGVLSIAPHANTLVDALTSVTLVFPNDLSLDEKEQYREKMQTFRKELDV